MSENTNGVETPGQKLDALKFSSRAGLNGLVVAYRYKRLASFFRGRSCLEMGSSDGQGIETLLSSFDEVVAVDGSRTAIDSLSARIRDPKLTAICSYFEDLALDRTFDTVLMGHILEHVRNPRQVIEVGKRHLAPGGVLIADVPNGNSIHRHMGVEMGLLGKVTDLNNADRSIGHQRVYLPEEFEKEFRDLGLRIVAKGGFFLKPLSNSQIDSMLSRDQIEALLRLGERFPELAAEMYVVCASS